MASVLAPATPSCANSRTAACKIAARLCSGRPRDPRRDLEAAFIVLINRLVRLYQGQGKHTSVWGRAPVPAAARPQPLRMVLVQMEVRASPPGPSGEMLIPNVTKLRPQSTQPAGPHPHPETRKCSRPKNECLLH